MQWQQLIIDGYVVTDRHGQWAGRPLYWFLDIIFNKYIFKERFHKDERWILSDVDDLYKHIKAFLNVYRYDFPTTPKEVDPIDY